MWWVSFGKLLAVSMLNTPGLAYPSMLVMFFGVSVGLERFLALPMDLSLFYNVNANSWRIGHMLALFSAFQLAANGFWLFRWILACFTTQTLGALDTC